MTGRNGREAEGGEPLPNSAGHALRSQESSCIHRFAAVTREEFSDSMSDVTCAVVQTPAETH